MSRASLRKVASELRTRLKLLRQAANPPPAVDITMPAKMASALAPTLGTHRYRLFKGGRGSGKSASVARAVALAGAVRRLKIVCAREFQVSIKDSFFSELKSAIESNYWLSSRYIIGENYIRGINSTEFIFIGLRRNKQSVKSLANVDLTIIEEAEYVPEASYIDLIPTVFRRDTSEVWVIWNPLEDGSATDVRFVKNTPPRSLLVEINHADNPFFPPALREVMEHDRARLDVNTFEHIWEGAYLKNTKAQVIADKVVVMDFEPGKGWDGPYFGCDWGFSTDPTAIVKCWIFNGDLYIDEECGGVGIDFDVLPKVMDERIPSARKHLIRADSESPASISALRKAGFNVIKVDKWPGCAEDRARFLRSFGRIVVKPKCREFVKESRLFMYKTNSAGDVLPVLVDAYNHYIDATGYALTPLIKNTKGRVYAA